MVAAAAHRAGVIVVAPHDADAVAGAGAPLATAQVVSAAAAPVAEVAVTAAADTALQSPSYVALGVVAEEVRIAASVISGLSCCSSR